MKLNIKTVEVKNFLSIGSQSIKLNFEKGLHAVTGKVVGQETNNGVGKSALFSEAIVFAFYGKTLRGLPQDKIINSINGCECEVTVEFDVDGNPYKIERGLKPNFLKLSEVGETAEEKEEQSSKKLTQSDIENLVNISMTSFINVISQNINYSTPFFKMEAQKKRDLLENIMNLTVFGKMFEKSKKDYSELKTELKILESDIQGLIKSYKDKVDTFKKLETIKESFENKKKIDQEECQKIIDELIAKSKEIDIPVTDYATIKDKIKKALESITDKKAEYNSTIRSNKTKIREDSGVLDSLKNNPVCPLCQTHTDSDHVKTHIKEKESTISNLKTENEDLDKKLKDLFLKEDELKDKSDKVRAAEDKLQLMRRTLDSINSKIQIEESKLREIQNRQLGIDQVITKEQISADKESIEEKKKTFSELKKKFKVCEKMKEILGDKGIKNYIIKKTLPFLNKRMNFHLSNLKAHYTITFDSQLNETLKSRNRDEFVYENFSGGEQKRIDVAWMFTSIDMSKLRNSIDCNVLVLDEVLDSSMCNNGIQTLMDYLKKDFRINNPDMCTYIITHKSEIKENDFDSVVRLKKINHFTKLDTIDKFSPDLQV